MLLIRYLVHPPMGLEKKKDAEGQRIKVLTVSFTQTGYFKLIYYKGTS